MIRSLISLFKAEKKNENEFADKLGYNYVPDSHIYTPKSMSELFSIWQSEYMDKTEPPILDIADINTLLDNRLDVTIFITKVDKLNDHNEKAFMLQKFILLANRSEVLYYVLERDVKTWENIESVATAGTIFGGGLFAIVKAGFLTDIAQQAFDVGVG
jgi:hypothetical protein